jgi:hypothetical protein
MDGWDIFRFFFLGSFFYCDIDCSKREGAGGFN